MTFEKKLNEIKKLGGADKSLNESVEASSKAFDIPSKNYNRITNLEILLLKLQNQYFML